MTLGLWFPQLLFWTIILSATLTRAQTQQAGKDFFDTTTCYDGLAQADANGDNRIKLDEYLTFLQLTGPPGFLADTDSMVDAPLSLLGSFLALACICRQNGGDAQCCVGENAHIPIDGGNIPDPSTSAFLSLVCSLTSKSIDLVLLEEPSSVPSTQPSSMPTEEGFGVGATTIYTVLIVNGITENVPGGLYVPDLIASMNVVAVEVALEVDFGSSNGSRRRLEVRVSLPTFIDGVVDAGGFTDTPEFVDGVFELGACPSNLANPDNDKCEQVTASVGLFLDNDEAPQVARQLYQTALNRAIVQGRLQDALMEINPDSPARILTGNSNAVNGSRSSEAERLSAGAILGIVIGALAVVGFMITLFIVRKRKEKPAVDKSQPVSSIPFGVEFELDSTAGEELDSAEKQRTYEEAGTVQSGEAISGAAKVYYRQSSSDADWSRADGVQIHIEGRSGASSTASAGQSDRPSICMSSLDSGSEYADELNPSTFGTITFVPETGSTELDNAVVAGDRAAVGATAALLAAKASSRCDYDESSFSSNQSSIETGDSSLKVRVDEQKAAELHRLIEGGDWEGIIRAASTYSSDNKSFAGSVLSNQDSQGSASDAVLLNEPESPELYPLIDGGDWEVVIRAASTFSSDDKSFDGSRLSHQDSKGSMHLSS